ncbi:MAG: cyclophilin-like fold protein [Phascolarctobacterium sp.]|nr:cyclophilin-like fold protein [Phascolarctobacterium sp.]
MMKKLAASLLACGLMLSLSACGSQASNQTNTAPAQKQAAANNTTQAKAVSVTLLVNGKELPVVWENSPLAKEILGFAPCEINMTNYGEREIYGTLPQKPKTQVEGRYRFTNGDVTYCAQNNSLAVFYSKGNPEQDTLTMKVVKIGHIQGDLSSFMALPASVSVALKPASTSSKVFFSKEITPASLVKIYKAVDRPLQGKVGLKLSFETPGGPYLPPTLLADLQKETQGTFMDSNGFSAPRNTTGGHMEVAIQHGFTKIGPVDILDAEGEMNLPVQNGRFLKAARTGSHFAKYDSFISLVKFKDHHIRDYGGTLKNLSICLASTPGKALIHSAGKTDSGYSPSNMEDFLMSAAEAAKAAVDARPGQWVFINVLSEFKPDDSCKDAPTMPNIGILASTDPVALDQAAVDMTYGKANEKQRIEWEQAHNTRLIKYAESIGLGSRDYQLVEVK